MEELLYLILPGIVIQGTVIQGTSLFMGGNPDSMGPQSTAN
jgi:hypothetical protein